MVFDDSENLFGLFVRQQIVAERDGVHLIGTNRCVVSLRSIDDVVQIRPFVIPKPLTERLHRSGPVKTTTSSIVRFLKFGSKPSPDVQRSDPEGLNFDRLSVPRSDYLIADFRIHPGELSPRNPARNKPISIDVNVVSSASAISIENLLDRRPCNGLNASRIFAVRDVPVDSMDKPQRRIDGVVLRRLLSVRKTIGNHPLRYVRSK